MEIKRHSQEEDIAKVLFSAEKIKAKVEHVAKLVFFKRNILSFVFQGNSQWNIEIFLLC